MCIVRFAWFIRIHLNAYNASMGPKCKSRHDNTICSFVFSSSNGDLYGPILCHSIKHFPKFECSLLLNISFFIFLARNSMRIVNGIFFTSYLYLLHPTEWKWPRLSLAEAFPRLESGWEVSIIRFRMTITQLYNGSNVSWAKTTYVTPKMAFRDVVDWKSTFFTLATLRLTGIMHFFINFCET